MQKHISTATKGTKKRLLNTSTHLNQQLTHISWREFSEQTKHHKLADPADYALPMEEVLATAPGSPQVSLS